jgi:NTP pyrophosphatase (non-canonical NTP hydrolase)
VNFQTQVRAFLARHGLGHAPQVHALDLTSEVGEVAKALLEASGYGRTALRPDAALVEELGDAFFSLAALADSLDVDLTAALSAALEKYEARLESQGHSGSGGAQST